MELTGQLISLDRTLPLVRVENRDLRAEYSAAFSKSGQKATVGDWLKLDAAEATAVPQITDIMPRTTLLARRICSEHPSIGAGMVDEQLLAANFDRIFVVVSLGKRRIDLNYLEGQLVAAYQSAAEVVLVLNKVDLCTYPLSEALVETADLAPDLKVIACSATTGFGMSDLSDLTPEGSQSVFFGRSGVGKSSLINALVGSAAAAVGDIRQRDQAGRHTTVARRMVFHNNRAYFDTPGLRSIGNYSHRLGLELVFSDVIEAAEQCHFRDCHHLSEPGCAVQQAIADGTLTRRRVDSYLALAAEVAGDDRL